MLRLNRKILDNDTIGEVVYAANKIYDLSISRVQAQILVMLAPYRK
jgi:hypothetical protein